MHLQKALLVFADDAVWGGDREAESKLKEMITELLGMLEMKHKDAQARIRTCMRIILATNSDWAARFPCRTEGITFWNLPKSGKTTTSFFNLLKKRSSMEERSSDGNPA